MRQGEAAMLSEQSSILSSLTCTFSREWGQCCSQAESMMAWHTARSLNMGSWMATLG
jgi:hypothetical protein